MTVIRTIEFHVILGWLLSAMICICLAVAPSALAQDAEYQPPDMTERSLSLRVEALEANKELSEEQKAQIKSSLETAIARLSDVTRLKELAAQYQNDLERGEAILEALQNDIATERDNLSKEPEPLGEMIGEAALYQLEQQLIQKESRLRALQAEAEGFTTSLQTLGARQVTAPTELSEARQKLAEVTKTISELGETNLDDVSAARRSALSARQYYRHEQIKTLEAEITSLPQRQEIIGGRRALANLRAEILSRDVTALQEQTGQRRVNEAAQIEAQAENRVRSLDGAHPAVIEMAQGNLNIAQQITEIAQKENRVSKQAAVIRGQQAFLNEDVAAASEIVSLGQLDREAGATLRSLEDQFVPPREIRANISKTRKDLARATQQRILAQENLRDLPLGRVDQADVQLMSQKTYPDAGDISPADLEIIQTLTDDRRLLLRQLSQSATTRINHVSELLTAQQALLTKTEELQSLLDENLLWVPSVPAIGLSWPAKVFQGGAEILSPKNLATAFQASLNVLRSLWPVFLLMGAFIFLTYRARPKIWEEVLKRAAEVGRVTDDSAWHTPSVVLAGIIIALPFPLLFLTIATIFGLSSNPAPIVAGLTQGFASLALFVLIFMSWRVWDRDKSLFAAHFKLPKSIRETVNKNLRWFMPIAGTGILLMGIASEFSSAVIEEGFSLFIFIGIALSMAWFGYRTLWARRHQWAELLSKDSFFMRHRGWISIFVVGAPLIVALLAGMGYLDSADALLNRLFQSGLLLLLAYVVYGTIKRAITVAQRQIKYRQAVERRDAALKAREEKLAAEERGEEIPTPPPIDTSAIDVTAVTKQSRQLLGLITITGLAILFWMIWSDLLPALSFFDGFQVWEYDTGKLTEDSLPIVQSVTVWNIIQSLAILALTIIAAKNLPGFLEVFVLNRVGVDAGMRYAATTILGYLIVGGGLVIAVNRLGLQWSQLKWIATGLSVGIGFGLQKIIANFVSGLIILFERPVRIGDYVTIGDKSGIVNRIQIRATTLADLDNREILIPNEELISQRVMNWTLTNSVTRLMVPVGIAYGSDTDKAREVMLETLKSIPKVLETPPPQVLFFGFGASSLDFELRVFLKNFDERVPMRHTIHSEINKALAAAGFTIPFPQTDLNIVSQDVPLQISSPPKPRAKSSSKKSPPKNKKEI